MSETAPIRGDAKLLPNGLHQETVEVVCKVLLEIAAGRAGCLERAIERDETCQDVLLEAGAVEALTIAHNVIVSLTGRENSAVVVLLSRARRLLNGEYEIPPMIH